ncbi:MAG: DUF401 family protein [bacterium]
MLIGHWSFVQTTLVILSAFAGILFLSRFRMPLGIALIAGGIGLDAWANPSPGRLVRDLATALAQSDVWLLLLICVLLLEFGRFLGAEANAKAILVAARQWGGRHGRAISLMVMPAAIGLVPMPGGALVSAPLVDRAVPEEDWSSEWKAAVNYWFRHVWEYWWPLFPVVIVTLSIFHVPTWQYMATLIPYSVMSIAAGYVFLVRPHLERLAGGATADKAEPARLRTLAIALGIVVAGTLVLPSLVNACLPRVSSQTNKMMAMAVGMAAGLAWLVWSDRGRESIRLFETLREGKSINQLSTLGGVMVFQSLLDSSGLLPRAGSELVGGGFPLPVVVALLPLVAGFVTGVAAGFAGVAFPLVVGLMNTSGSGLTPLATLALAFGFGYAGMMLSPVHLCLILTRNYFDAPMAFIYRHLRPCIASLMIGAVGLFVLLRWFGV